jgi:hypothetical protein
MNPITVHTKDVIVLTRTQLTPAGKRTRRVQMMKKR